MKAQVLNGISFTDEDVVNKDDYIPAGEYNPYLVRPWLFHDHGFTLAVVFASNLQDALDELADSGKIDHLQLDPNDPEERSTYGQEADSEDGDGPGWDWNPEVVSFLGNADEPFDIEGVSHIQMEIPKFSFAALYSAMHEPQASL